jgi:hypothetical protein
MQKSGAQLVTEGIENNLAALELQLGNTEIRTKP